MNNARNTESKAQLISLSSAFKAGAGDSDAARNLEKKNICTDDDSWLDSMECF